MSGLADESDLWGGRRSVSAWYRVRILLTSKHRNASKHTGATGDRLGHGHKFYADLLDFANRYMGHQPNRFVGLRMARTWLINRYYGIVLQLAATVTSIYASRSELVDTLRYDANFTFLDCLRA